MVKVAPGVLQFNGKAVLQDLTTGESIAGGETFQLIVTDGAPDKAGITLYNSKTGGLWFSSGWGPSAIGQPPQTQQKALASGSGNIAVY
jgi:hypothetical protein